MENRDIKLVSVGFAYGGNQSPINGISGKFGVDMTSINLFGLGEMLSRIRLFLLNRVFLSLILT